ncbi:radical SAM protein [Patescibacteria group bacterium]|nr:radical SAM protein [Patescibacteria group bacterium]
MQYVTRDFGNASFIFNTQTGDSLFLNGTLASQALQCVNRSDFKLPETFLSQFNRQDQNDILNDWSAIQQLVKKFLKGKSPSNENILNGPKEKNSLELLSEYAICNWVPINVNLELTGRCNQRCRGCYLDNFDAKGLIKQHLFRLGNDLLAENSLFLLLTGGEIFLRPDAMEIMNYYTKLGFILEIKTNGSLLNDKIIKDLSALTLLDVQISIYEVSDGWSDYTQTVYPIKQIECSVKAMADAGIPLTLSVLVGKHNIDRIREIHDYLLRLGVNIFYSPYITPNRSGNGKATSFRLSAKEMEGKLRPFLEEINGFTPQKIYRNCQDSLTVCYAGRDQIAIGPDGIVYPCLDLRLPLGNLLQQPIKEILISRRKTMEQFSLREMTQCNVCHLRDYCDSCIGIALVENGDFRKPSRHKCDVINFYSHKKEVKQ